MILNISNQALEDQKAFWTAKEISQQPATWRETLDIVLNTGVRAFVEPLVKRAKRGELRIIFTGAGTSAFIGNVVSPILSEKLGCVVEAIASTDLVSSPYQYLFEDKPTLLVSFARSGNSPESIGAVDRVNDIVKEVYHLAITNNINGSLFIKCSGNSNAYSLALPDSTHDQGFAMTSSASNMILAALLTFAPNCFDHHWVDSFVTVTECLLKQDITKIQELAHLPLKRIVYLGSGHFQGLARETALKLLELTAGERLGFFESTMGFRHGPKSLVQGDTLIFIFLSQNSYTQKYDKDLYNELLKDKKAHEVVLLGDENGLFKTDISTLDDAARIFPYLVIGQLYSFYSSLHLGYTTDNPCPTGEVNRVVQGVTLYSYK
ncbi:galactosamine 6-phosphate isomerase AgaS [Bisgaardia hudsonensis]|uniref:Galactosamine 6-phosphate isomerase AgaS n=1 Tax=Bisgaardia hudsonensis TaxID=109472 RepID=A0A4R2N1J3_9PAST|nr:SIS domain-containing protein [Bisgaardia hudsonensis]QLB13017.1 tagatose-6-phosphate ketose isomerase [Bisgaardia hudsonensis]TCP13419.1 galactosamine 6-phosphate isomerase AgaS [Bisgaardia hudsonensis]